MAVPSLPKNVLRSKAQEQRRSYARALGPEVRQNLETRLAQIVLPHLARARIVAGYSPLKDEISPLGVLEGLSAAQTRVLPWFADRDAAMVFRKGSATEPGPWGFLQPSGLAEMLQPDVILVPLVMADRHGTRIGQGKGHYDRALARLRAQGPIMTIGIAWTPQISDEPIAADPWDISLDAIATPSEWIICQSQAGESLPG